MIAAALALGLSSGAYCVGGCLPVMMPLVFHRRTSWSERAKTLALFSAGRLAAYTLFGMGAAAASGACPPALVRGAALASMLGLAPLLILYGVRGHGTASGCGGFLAGGARGGGRRPAVLLGFLTGINICPPFLLALSSVMLEGRILDGAVFFGVFFTATSLYFLPFLFLGRFSLHEPVRVVGRIFSALAGGIYVLAAFHLLTAA